MGNIEGGETVDAEEEEVGRKSGTKSEYKHLAETGHTADSKLPKEEKSSHDGTKPKSTKRATNFLPSIASIGLVAIVGLLIGISYFKKRAGTLSNPDYMNVSERRSSKYSLHFSEAVGTSYEAPFLISV